MSKAVAMLKGEWDHDSVAGWSSYVFHMEMRKTFEHQDSSADSCGKKSLACKKSRNGLYELLVQACSSVLMKNKGNKQKPFEEN